MRARENAVRPLLALFVVSVLLAALVAGCGGGDQSGNERDKKQQGGEEQGGKAADTGGSDRKIALGTIRAFEEDKRKVYLKPAAEARGEKQLSFKVNKRADITLGGKKAEIGDIARGQQAQIGYVDRAKGPGRALSVNLFGVPGQQEPSEEGGNAN
jgi:hypothetical protein